MNEGELDPCDLGEPDSPEGEAYQSTGRDASYVAEARRRVQDRAWSRRDRDPVREVRLLALAIRRTPAGHKT